jgi:FkbM family methyltransferase
MTIERRLLYARVPVALECPDEMLGSIAGVLDGEYESGYFGERLTLVDIGANVGSFALWASMRWPGSTIHAYEPNPGSFDMLVRNVAALPGVICHPQAVYPGEPSRQMFYSRYAGDGEGGLASYIGKTFRSLPEEHLVAVPTIPPRDLPPCDVLKIDVEGAEASILQEMDLANVSLILLEYQDEDNRRSITRCLQADFECVFQDSFPWNRILPDSDYRQDLAGNSYGHLFFVNRRGNRLSKLAGADSGAPPARMVVPGEMSLPQVLAALPAAAGRAVRSMARAMAPNSVVSAYRRARRRRPLSTR